MNLKVNPGGVKNLDVRRIFLPSEGFKGILAAPRGVAAGFSARGWNGEASVWVEILHLLCLDMSQSIEPIPTLLRQTLRADR